ncbi:unnamed protein product [Bursaphelenchus okinawaensis]|uniref:Uncharacterized protein n=1 Tax=Bursaphelenchus okinawaensis TaxID=465554 RepID=A0A811LDR5_9BILA|nr:unnamed protein product [Bursaphelenchus okinawaensis]CAG9123385.1 unnamed protein product [Bursaphelenchus okinawaensis]
MPKVICSVVLLLLLTVQVYTQSVAVRSVQVKGAFKCGTEVAKNARVVLYRVPANDAKKINAIEELESREISPAGLFEISANTNGRPTNETDLKPAIRVYHRCDVDDKKKKDQTRSFQVAVPDSFVSLGKTAKQTFDIGTLNLELEYPGEAWVKNDKKKA